MAFDGFGFTLLDVWNRPEMKALRKGGKMAYTAARTAQAKKQYEQSTTTELEKLLKAAQAGDHEAQCDLGIYYGGNRDSRRQAIYWLEKSAARGNERAKSNYVILESSL